MSNEPRALSNSKSSQLIAHGSQQKITHYEKPTTNNHNYLRWNDASCAER